ncbi:hypothetical protein L0Y69_03265, partial [bacterium]|nr:hypothetical protein [bacterium]
DKRTIVSAGARNHFIFPLFFQNEFAQRRISHRRKKLPNPKGGKKPAPSAWWLETGKVEVY